MDGYWHGILQIFHFLLYIYLICRQKFDGNSTQTIIKCPNLLYIIMHTCSYVNVLCYYTEAYRPLCTSGQPVAADKEIQEQLREHVVRTTGVEVGTVLGDLKVLAAHSFLHLLLAICGDLMK